MKILALSPFEPGSTAGNVVTLSRVQAGLRDRGHMLAIVHIPEGMTPEQARRIVRESAPDVVHFYQAYKTGRLLAPLRFPRCIVTLGGTDINHDFLNPVRRPVIEAALRGAGRIVSYNASLADRVREAWPELAVRIRVIPKGVSFGAMPYDLRGGLGLEPTRPLFLHAGGIRPVKDNLFALENLGPQVHLVFAGPILHEAYGREFRRRLSCVPWARHVEHIPHAAMKSVTLASDVILNTSISEGLSNTIIESMTLGRPVLASDVPGNRELIRDGLTGFLYSGREDFARKVRRLPQEGPRLAREAMRMAAERFSTRREIDALLAAYEEA